MASNKTIQIKKDLIKAMELSHCIVTDACRTVGISRKTYYDYYKNDEEFKDAIDEIENTALDFVEGKLYEKIESGDTTSIIFYLKTKGKSRGYVEKVEHEHKGSLEHKIIEWKPAQ